MAYSADQALEQAVKVACESPCQKSKRGVVLWHPERFDILCGGYNHLPRGFSCNGSQVCRENCSTLCIHAEMTAILEAQCGIQDFHMLHVKVVDGKAVPSGPPSCVECSKHILKAGIDTMWLLHEEGLCGYSAVEFHKLSLRQKGILQPPEISLFSDEILTEALRNCRNHRKDLSTSICGCFACLTVFHGSFVQYWIDKDQTALCPLCCLDTVLPVSKQLHADNSDFLKAMKHKWLSPAVWEIPSR